MLSIKTRWVKFADSIEVLESMLNNREIASVQIRGERKLLIRHDESFFLTSPTCPHQGAKLDHAKCEAGKIICPWHHYAFDLKTGRGAGLYLTNHPVEKREDGYYAGFEYFSWFGE